MPIGLILSLFTILIISSIFLFNNKLKKLFNSYYFYLISSILGLSYFIIFRWTQDLIDLINNNERNYAGGLSVVKSKVFLLDMCPFLAFLIPVMLIFDKKRQWVPSIAYFAIVGGGITIFGQIMFEKIGVNGSSHLLKTTWWEYIFLNKLYFLMHFYIFVMAFIIILNSKSLNWYKVLVAHVYAILFFTYVTIMIFAYNIEYNATGLVQNDWIQGGQYEVVGKIFNLPWPGQPILCFILVWIWILIMMCLRNTLVVDKKYIDEKHINIWFFRKFYLNLYNKYFNKKAIS